MNKYYTGEPFNIHIQSLRNIMQEKIGQSPPKKGRGKLPLFCGNGERLIPIYASYAKLLLKDVIGILVVVYLHIYSVFSVDKQSRHIKKREGDPNEKILNVYYRRRGKKIHGNIIPEVGTHHDNIKQRKLYGMLLLGGPAQD